MKFEAHITLNLLDAELGQQMGDQFNWKTSQIARDPVLGDATYFYLTAYDSDFVSMLGRMHMVADEVTNRGGKVVREKIEMIVYDTKGL